MGKLTVVSMIVLVGCGRADSGATGQDAAPPDDAATPEMPLPVTKGACLDFLNGASLSLRPAETTCSYPAITMPTTGINSQASCLPDGQAVVNYFDGTRYWVLYWKPREPTGRLVSAVNNTGFCLQRMFVQ
jgi:hypothetical protein